MARRAHLAPDRDPPRPVADPSAAWCQVGSRFDREGARRRPRRRTRRRRRRRRRTRELGRRHRGSRRRTGGWMAGRDRRRPPRRSRAGRDHRHLLRRLGDVEHDRPAVGARRRPVHHIVDPRTGFPAREVWRTVSVTAGSCVDANTASTAAIVLGEDASGWLAARSLPARLVRPDGDITRVGGWPDRAAA